MGLIVIAQKLRYLSVLQFIYSVHEKNHSLIFRKALENAVEVLNQENAEMLRENRGLRQQVKDLIPHVDMVSYRRQQNR